MLASRVLSILELNRNQRFRDRKSRKVDKLSSPFFVDITAKLRSIHVVERKRTTCYEMYKTCKATYSLSHCQICKFMLPIVMLQKFAIPRKCRTLNIKRNKQGFPRSYDKALLSSKAAPAPQRCLLFFYFDMNDFDKYIQIWP